MYCIHHLSPSDAKDDDETMIVQLERSENEGLHIYIYIYKSLPTCPFEPGDVSGINNGILRCTMTYISQRTVRDTVRGIQVSSVVYIESDNTVHLCIREM